jgi:fused signal recognition particle receptor
MGFFDSIRKGLTKTRERLGGAFGKILTIGRKIDEELLDEIEETLIRADLGPRFAMQIVDDLRAKYKAREIEHADEIVSFLKDEITRGLTEASCELQMPADGPAVLMLVGVNGTGKTTTAAKLAQRYAADGKRVLLAAADTFRAAAGEQLELWAERLGV